MTYTLYSYYRSSSSYRVRIALNLKGIKYDINPVHLVKDGGGQHTPQYHKINPQELVPSLVDEDGNILTQSAAIVEYLDEICPKPALMPKDPLARAYVRQIVNIVTCDMHPLNNLRVLTHLTSDLGVSQQHKQAWYEKWIRLGFEALEEIITRSPHYTGRFCCGDSVTAADLALIPQVYNAARYECDMSKYPVIAAINDECLKLAPFIDAAPENQPDTPEDHRPVFARK